LPANFEVEIDPAGNVLETIWHHPAFFTEPPIDLWRRALFETFDDHVKHVLSSEEFSRSGDE
jgi:hypothetical protein